MNAEQFKRTNNTFFLISSAAILISLIITFFNINFEIPVILKGIACAAAVICIAICCIGKFNYSTEIKGAYRIALGGILACMVLMILTDNPVFLSLALPVIIFSIMYYDTKICILEISLLSAGFILSVVKMYTLNSSIYSDFIPAFFVLILSSLSCYSATTLIIAIKQGKTFADPVEPSETQKTDEMLDLDLWLDDEEDHEGEESIDYLDDDYEPDETEDDDFDEMPSSIYIPQAETDETTDNDSYGNDIPADEIASSEPIVINNDNVTSANFNESRMRDEIDEMERANKALTARNNELLDACGELVKLLERSNDQFISLKNLYSDFQDSIHSLAAKDTAASNNLDAGNKLIEEIDQSASYAGKLSDSILETSNNVKVRLASSTESINKSKEISVVSKEGALSCIKLADELSEKLRNVQEYADTLSSMSKQAELLSLNASIESARAGEAGKGFASVAGDVREFGNEAGRITAEVISGINNLTDELETIKNSINETSKSIEQQNGKLDEAVGSLDELGNTLSEYSYACDGITQKLDSIRVSSAAVSGDLQALDDDNRAVITAIAELAKTSGSISTGLDMYKLLLSEILEQAENLKNISVSEE